MKIKRRIYVLAFTASVVIVLTLNFALMIISAKENTLSEIKVEYIGTNGSILTDAYDFVETVKTPGKTDYVMVNNGYQFSGMNEYTKVASYLDPVVATSALDINDFTFSTIEHFDEQKRLFSDYGIYHTELKKLKYGIPEYHKLFNGYLDKRYAGCSVPISSRSYMKIGTIFFSGFLRKNSINIMLESSLSSYPEQHILAKDYKKYGTISYEVGAVFDLYIKNNAQNPEAIKFDGMKIIEPNETHYDNILNYTGGNSSDQLEVIAIFMFLFLLTPALFCWFLVKMTE